MNGKMTTLEKLVEALRLLEEAEVELDATHPMGLAGTRLRINGAIALLSAEEPEADQPEVTNDG